MSRAVVVAKSAGSALANLVELRERAADYVEAARADNTRRAHAADWSHFATWCQAQGVEALPAGGNTLAAYITCFAGKLKNATLGRRLVAIRNKHKEAGHELDLGGKWAELWRGIRRVHGEPQKKKRALLTAELRKILAVLPDNLLGKRDRALLLVGFAGALRRSELVAVGISGTEHRIEQRGETLVLHLGRAKTDQEAEGKQVGIPAGSHAETCPVAAYRAWIEAAGITEGPVFRMVDRHGNVRPDALSPEAVRLVVRRAVERAAAAEGWSREKAEELASEYAGHSLRSGLATSAAISGSAGHLIQRHMRHAKYETTLGYIRSGELFRDNVAASVGL
jgi:integrase